MKKFKDGDDIDCNMLEEGEIIQFENHYLKVKIFEGVKNPCKQCFFQNEEYHIRCGYHIECSVYTTNFDEYENQELDYEVIFEEISEIEALVLLGDKNEKI